MLRIIISPAFDKRGKRLHSRFEATLNGRQLCVSREPLLAAARLLIAEGADPADTLIMRHAGSPHDAMTAPIGAAAKWTVRENEIQSPTFVRWEAFPASRVRSPMRFGERPVPETHTGNAAERIHDSDRVSP